MDLQEEREEFSSMLATTFDKTVEVAGRSLIGHIQWDRWELWQVRNRRGGFLPVFWNVPRADIHAVENIGAVVGFTERSFKVDAKSSLAVLHNRNDMITLFRAGNWV